MDLYVPSLGCGLHDLWCCRLPYDLLLDRRVTRRSRVDRRALLAVRTPRRLELLQIIEPELGDAGRKETVPHGAGRLQLRHELGDGRRLDAVNTELEEILVATESLALRERR